MGCRFDREEAARYSSWARGEMGQAMDRWLESCLPGLLRFHPRERVLDIGSGLGSHMLILKKMGLDVTGVDASPYMIQRARERVGQGCELRAGLAEDLPFDDNSFDLSVMVNTLEFLEDPLQVLREAGRVTRRAVFIGVLNSVSWSGLMRRLSIRPPSPPMDHCRYFNLWELKGLMRRALGDVPIRWQSSSSLKPFVGRVCRMVSGSGHEPSLPFGAFLGISADVVYHLKTDNLTLRVPVRSRGRTIPDGAAMGKHRRSSGVRSNERGLSV